MKLSGSDLLLWIIFKLLIQSLLFICLFSFILLLGSVSVLCVFLEICCFHQMFLSCFYVLLMFTQSFYFCKSYCNVLLSDLVIRIFFFYLLSFPKVCQFYRSFKEPFLTSLFFLSSILLVLV